NDDALTQVLVRDDSTGDIKYRTASSLGGSGITNGADTDELMLSDGTDAVASGLFVSTLGNLELGTGLSGGGRTIMADSTETDAYVVLRGKGTGTVYLGHSGSAGTQINGTNLWVPTGNMLIGVGGVNDGLIKPAGNPGVGVASHITIEGGVGGGTTPGGDV